MLVNSYINSLNLLSKVVFSYLLLELKVVLYFIFCCFSSSWPMCQAAGAGPIYAHQELRDGEEVVAALVERHAGRLRVAVAVGGAGLDDVIAQRGREREVEAYSGVAVDLRIDDARHFPRAAVDPHVHTAHARGIAAQQLRAGPQHRTLAAFEQVVWQRVRLAVAHTSSPVCIAFSQPVEIP